MFKNGADYDMNLCGLFNKGRSYPAEHCAKISEASKKRALSYSARVKISKKLKGRITPDETKLKISKNHKKNYYNYYTPAGYFECHKEALKANNCTRDQLVSRCGRETFPDWYRVAKDQKQ